MVFVISVRLQLSRFNIGRNRFVKTTRNRFKIFQFVEFESGLAKLTKPSCKMASSMIIIGDMFETTRDCPFVCVVPPIFLVSCPDHGGRYRQQILCSGRDRMETDWNVLLVSSGTSYKTVL